MAETASQAEMRLLWESHEKHLESDNQKFDRQDARAAALEASVNRINMQIAEWLGQFKLAKWALGAIISILLTNLWRHWGTP